jgi:hypothetical protein
MLIDDFDYSIICNETDLCKIMKKNGSDKGLGWHNYTIIYDKLFNEKRNDELNIFELGIGSNDVSIKSNMGSNYNSGASLYGWSEYFKNSKIYGADIDKKILFENERIRTFYCDQLNKNSIMNMWKHPLLSNLSFDIIIEDGLHTFDANLSFLINSIHKLRKNGIYIIEDLLPETVKCFDKYFQDNFNMYKDFNIQLLNIPGANRFDNRLLILSYK